jgi:hypothetical protein
MTSSSSHSFEELRKNITKYSHHPHDEEWENSIRKGLSSLRSAELSGLPRKGDRKRSALAEKRISMIKKAINKSDRGKRKRHSKKRRSKKRSNKKRQ